MYTTFTISSKVGKVVGCVDVAGKAAAIKGQELKEKLLLDCGIAYIVVSVDKLPSVMRMRCTFLGEVQADPLAHQVTRGGDSVFYAELDALAKVEA